MDGLSISEVAERTGFRPSTLRFYERTGLIAPARTRAGYRSYDQAAVETLRFIARAKRLGLGLDDIAQLVALLDDRRCQPLQEHLRQLLDDELGRARERIAGLIAFTARLQQAAARLEGHTPDGPCDEACGCTTDPAPALAVPTPAAAGTAPTTGPVDVHRVPLVTGSGGTDPVPIACGLDAGAVTGRLAAWHEALGPVTGRLPLEGGVRLRLPRDTPLPPLVALIDAEQRCCAFFAFSLHVGGDELLLDVTAPPAGRSVVHALVGAPG